MPRCAKTKSLIKFLDKEQLRISGGVSHNGYILSVPHWAVPILRREGIAGGDGWNIGRLPSGKLVRDQLPNSATYAIVYLSPSRGDRLPESERRIDISRFKAKSQTETLGTVGEVRRPTVRSQRPFAPSTWSVTTVRRQRTTPDRYVASRPRLNNQRTVEQDLAGD